MIPGHFHSVISNFLYLLKSKSPESVCKKTLTWSRLSRLDCRCLKPISYTPLYKLRYNVGRNVGIPVIQPGGRYQCNPYLIFDSILYVLSSYFSENCLKICTLFKTLRWCLNSELTFMDFSIKWSFDIKFQVNLIFSFCRQRDAVLCSKPTKDRGLTKHGFLENIWERNTEFSFFTLNGRPCMNSACDLLRRR
jgi:hypothetical protein